MLDGKKITGIHRSMKIVRKVNIHKSKMKFPYNLDVKVAGITNISCSLQRQFVNGGILVR
jgi:hypothetical protein